jgi:hypothetical protein
MSLPKFNLSKLRDSVSKQQEVTKKDIANLLLLDRLQAQMRREKTENKEPKIKEDKIPYGKVVLLLKLRETSNKEEYMVLEDSGGDAGDRFRSYSYDSYEDDLLSNIARSECIGRSDEAFSEYIGEDIYTFFNEGFHFSIVWKYEPKNGNLELVLLSNDTIFEYLEGLGISDYEGDDKKLKNDVVSFLTNTIKKAFGIKTDYFLDKYEDMCDELDIPKDLRLKSLSENEIPCIIGLDLLSVEAYMGTNPDIS